MGRENTFLLLWFPSTLVGSHFSVPACHPSQTPPCWLHPHPLPTPQGASPKRSASPSLQPISDSCSHTDFVVSVSSGFSSPFPNWPSWPCCKPVFEWPFCSMTRSSLWGFSLLTSFPKHMTSSALQCWSVCHLEMLHQEKQNWEFLLRLITRVVLSMNMPSEKLELYTRHLLPSQGVRHVCHVYKIPSLNSSHSSAPKLAMVKDPSYCQEKH